MKKFLGVLLSTVFCSSVIFSTNYINVNAAEVAVSQNIYDMQVIPDEYNTGCQGELTPWREALGFDENTETCYITPEIQMAYGEDCYLEGQYVEDAVTFKNIDFSDVTVILNKENLKNIAFENCYFGVNAPYSVSLGNNWAGENFVAFVNCTFSNATSAAATIVQDKILTYYSCLFKDMANKGAFANNSGFYNCYFTNINGNAIATLQDNSMERYLIFNCRFDKTICNNNDTTTSCINISTTSSDASTIFYIYLNGGQYPLILSVEKPDESVNFLFENIFIGDNYKGGGNNRLNIDDTDTFNVVKNAISDVNSLYVSSVLEETNKTSLIVTNYTNDERTLLVVTNDGSYKATINACPDYETGLTYTSKTEFPFDLKVSIPDGNPDYVVCYDVTDVSNPKQVRFVNNTVNDVYVNVDESLASAMVLEGFENSVPEEIVPGESSNGNIKFEANITSWFEVIIPNSYRLTDTENSLEFTVRGDIAGNKALSVTTTENVVLKNVNDEELEATVFVNKDSFIYSELENGAVSNILISVDALPAGRFVGELPIYISIVDLDDSEVIAGNITETITYNIKNNVMTVSGTGALPNYAQTYEEYKDMVSTVIIEDGITALNLKNFIQFSNLETVYLGNDLDWVGKYVFQNCSNLKSIYLPASIDEFDVGCFANVHADATLYYSGTEEQFNQITGVENLTHLNILYEQTW